MRTYFHLPLRDLIHYWIGAENGAYPKPWHSPPLIEVSGMGPVDVRALMVLTVTNTVYNLTTYQEFYRIMYRDGQLRIVHENGRSEPIITAHTTFVHPLAPILDNVVQLFPGPLKA